MNNIDEAVFFGNLTKTYLEKKHGFIDEAMFLRNSAYADLEKHMVSSMKPCFNRILARQIWKKMASSMKPYFYGNMARWIWKEIWLHRFIKNKKYYVVVSEIKKQNPTLQIRLEAAIKCKCKCK